MVDGFAAGEGLASVTADGWMARAAVYELLSMGLLLPAEELAEALSSGEYAEAFEEASELCGVDAPDAAALLAGCRGVDSDELFHGLRHEFTMLFSQAPKPLVTPFVGVWFDESRGRDALLFVGKESMAIERFMRRCGVAKDLSAGQSNDPMDHVGTVCEFLEFLCLVNARAVAPAEGFEVRESDYADFLREHFADYALWLSGELEARSASPFYQAVTPVLAAFVKSELKRLDA